MKYFYISLLLCISSYCMADSAYDVYYSNENSKDILSNDEIRVIDDLNKNAKAGMDGMGLNGFASNSNEVLFSFGSGRVNIITAILQLTDIQLQANEVISSVQIGDSTRFNVSYAKSGTQDGDVMHVIIKPLDSNLRTSMVITTNKRTYYINIKSTAKDYMASVRFIYNDEQSRNLNFIQHKQFPHDTYVNKKRDNLNLRRQNLSYDFKIRGDDEIKPIKIYCDDKKTYIVMSKQSLQFGAPALLLTNENGFFKKDSNTTLNYRLVNNTYVVDGIIQNASLIHHINGKELKVLIKKGA